MSNCYIDSNVLVNLKFTKSSHHKRASRILEILNPDDFQIYISSLTIDEIIHSLNFLLKHDGYAKKGRELYLENAIKSILGLPHLEIINPPTDKTKNKSVLKLMKEFSLRPRDAYHLLTMQEHDIKNFATFDNDFRKVVEKKVIIKVI